MLYVGVNVRYIYEIGKTIYRAAIWILNLKILTSIPTEECLPKTFGIFLR